MAFISNQKTRKSLIKWSVIGLVALALGLFIYNKLKPKEETPNVADRKKWELRPVKMGTGFNCDFMPILTDFYLF